MPKMRRVCIPVALVVIAGLVSLYITHHNKRALVVDDDGARASEFNATVTETLEDFRCYLTACDAAATAACCGGATCATVDDAACCRRSVWARGGGDYAWVPHEALRCVGGSCRAEGFGPHCDEACAPYVTGRWCTRRVAADAVLAPRAHLSDADYDARLSRACRDPEGVVVDRRGRVVPRLHAEAHGNALGSCVASLADDVVFVGDSQTKMMRFEYARWLDGGRREPYGIAVDEFGPAPGAVPDEAAAPPPTSMAALVAARGYDGALAGAFEEVTGVYAKPKRGFEDKKRTNLNATLERLAERTRRNRARRGLYVVGFGVWDLTFSGEDDVVGWFEAEFAAFFPRLLDLVAGAYDEADVILRNLWTSFERDKGASCGALPEVARSEALNGAIRRVFDAAAPPANVHLHLLDVEQLSRPRRFEMPQTSDGLHWACNSKASFPGGASRCRYTLHSVDRPDEVAWAGLQIALHEVCARRGLYAR